jgi:hypothetical protein
MSSFPLCLPDDLAERTAAQAEAGCRFAARAARVGQGKPLLPGDELDGEDGQA